MGGGRGGGEGNEFVMKIPFFWRGYRLFVRRYHFLGRMTDIGSAWKIPFPWWAGDGG